MANSLPGWEYPRPPAYRQGPLVPGSTARPAAMQWAIFLMWAGAAVAAVQGTVLGLTTNNVSLYTSTSSSTGTVHDSRSLVSGIIQGIILGCLWAWMAWKNGAGRDWARVLSTVFFGLLCLQLVGGMVAMAGNDLPAGDFIIRLAEWGVGLAALVCLWQRESSEFFALAKQAKQAKVN
jgi:hypothetical protein